MKSISCLQYQFFESVKVNNHVVYINYIRSSSGTTACELLVPIDAVLACAWLWSIIIKLRFDFFGVLVYGLNTFDLVPVFMFFL